MAESVRDLKNLTNGTYSTPRRCPACTFRTSSRDAYWRHYLSEHGGLGKP